MKHIPTIAGVEASFREEGILMQLVVLKRKGQQIDVLKRARDIAAIDQLIVQLPPNIPIVISLNGKGIIHRFVKQEELAGSNDVLRLVLPNAKKQDFHIQEVRQQNTSIVSVIRKDRLEEMWQAFTVLKSQVLSLTIGPFAVLPLLSAIRKDDQTAFVFGQHHLQLRGEDIVGYQWQESADRGSNIIRIGNEELNEGLVAAFSTGFSVISELSFPSLVVDWLEGRIAEKKAFYQFRRSAMALMLCFLLVLLANTYFFMHYTEENSRIQVTDASLVNKEIERLKQVLETQEQLVGVIQTGSRSDRAPLSYVANKIGASVPKEILLDEMTFFPADEVESRKVRKPVYRPDILQIMGSTSTITALNHWVKVLGMWDFLDEVSLLHYKYDEKQERGLFTLNITLSP